MSFIIHDKQIEALSQALVQRADKNLVTYITSRFPEEFERQGQAGILSFVAEVRKTAKDYGITREDNVGTFLDFSVMYGKAFHRDNWAKEVLESEKLPGPYKIALLKYYVGKTGVIL